MSETEKFSTRGSMKCIVCLKDYLIDFGYDDGWVSCADGVVSDTRLPAKVCEATGNYGSTVFDPFDGGEVMQFLVCDDCLKERGDHINVFKVRSERPKVHRVKKTFSEYLKSDFEMDTHRAIQELRGEDTDASPSSG